MPLHHEFDMKFTLRMTRCLLIATSTHSLTQSSVYFTSSSTICLARGSSNRPNHQQVHLLSLPRRRMAPCNCVSISGTSTRLLRRISTQSHPSPISSTNLAAQRSTPSSTSALATTMFRSHLDMSGRQSSKHVMALCQDSSLGLWVFVRVQTSASGCVLHLPTNSVRVFWGRSNLRSLGEV